MSTPPDHLTLPWNHACCALHGEPLRARWPMGAADFIDKLGRALKASPEFQIETDCFATNERVAAALDEKPACCRISPLILLGIYESIGIGERKRCQLCRCEGLGTPYKMISSHYEHLCFDCLVRRVVPGDAG